MPTAVTHLLVPIFITALFRDYILKKKDKKKFPLHYVLIAGLGGVLPDADILAYVFLGFFNFTIEQIHRTATHSFFAVGLLLIIGLITWPLKNKTLGKHNLQVHWIFIALAFGVFMHMSLDGLIQGDIHPFSPFSDKEFGLNLIGYLPIHLQGLAIPLFEGILLLSWLIYLEWKHKISDFI